MTPRNYILLYLLGQAIVTIVARFEHSPGYMDADYYHLNGQQLATGEGFTEPAIWNYLDDPQGIPHPSHSYWQPLASLIAAIGIYVGGINFESGRSLFVLLSGLVSPLTARLGWELTKNKRGAIFAGVLACLPGFYLPYLPTSDTFAVTMLLGGVFFLLLSITLKKQHIPWQMFCVGVVTGLIHLARTEGLFWLLVVLVALWFSIKRKPNLIWVIAGYIIVMGPWMVRNWTVFGTLLQPGAVRTLWLTSYDELFSFPAGLLTPTHWLSSGWAAMLQTRLGALIQNLLSAFSVNGLIFLSTLMIWGGWKFRNNPSVRAAAGVLLAVFLLMSLVFPFSGARGGFFHAAAGLQPLFWVLAAVGMEAFIAWGSKVRGWKKKEAFSVLAAGSIILAAAFSAYVVEIRVVGADANQSAWDESALHYEKLSRAINEAGISKNQIVMVNNPPGFTLASGHPSIVIPNGNEWNSIEAAGQYDATILLLEKNHPPALNDLYDQPNNSSYLTYLETVDGTHIFLIP